MKIIVRYSLLFCCFIVSACAVEPVIAASSLELQSQEAHGANGAPVNTRTNASIMESSSPQLQSEVVHGANGEVVNMVNNASLMESSSPQIQSEVVHGANGEVVNMVNNASLMESSSAQIQTQLINGTLVNLLNNTSLIKFSKLFFENIHSFYLNWENVIKRNTFVMSPVLFQLKRTASYLLSNNLIEKSNQLISVYRNVSSSNNLNLKSIFNKMLSYKNNNTTNTSSIYTLTNMSPSDSKYRLLSEEGRQYNLYDDNYISHDDSYGYMSYGGGNSYHLDPYTLLAALASAAFIAATGWKVVHWKKMGKRSVKEYEEYDQNSIEKLLSMVLTALEKFQ